MRVPLVLSPGNAGRDAQDAVGRLHPAYPAVVTSHKLPRRSRVQVEVASMPDTVNDCHGGVSPGAAGEHHAGSKAELIIGGKRTVVLAVPSVRMARCRRAVIVVKCAA